jgi:hypothetical protein
MSPRELTHVQLASTPRPRRRPGSWVSLVHKYRDGVEGIIAANVATQSWARLPHLLIIADSDVLARRKQESYLS